MVKLPIGSCSLMDRTLASEAGDMGSTPIGNTKLEEVQDEVIIGNGRKDKRQLVL